VESEKWFSTFTFNAKFAFAIGSSLLLAFIGIGKNFSLFVC